MHDSGFEDLATTKLTQRVLKHSVCLDLLVCKRLTFLWFAYDLFSFDSTSELNSVEWNVKLIQKKTLVEQQSLSRDNHSRRQGARD